ncbi:transmembrane and coiled-coil domains protein 1 isoform X1 [Micropterus dolomieu]|uniref:transmembrane and coiled-coil domains protein 1 isoform X1 n=1 Tax=Micropterus dolomieu TaxID=147949 RepID=UPI001E8E0AEF|nr:transmembrane and coiled-coil domains protein 1 isoform X1 [Micropterus dolomieu]XP_045913032.1 transmembrane and coiled-coil domains protein 1 isoform X1 [Micropterus dolomieu]XP_045913033.1 transmembrane and coiled-coil domains protein 1 isoform X1 [Micropterus dolomieu]
MQQGDDSQREPEGVGPSSGPTARREALGSQGQGLKRASSQSEHTSFSKMSQNARESMGVLGQGLKQLFQQQRKRLSLSRSTTPSSSSSSSSSVVSAGGIPPSAPEDASGSCCPESDHLSAPVVPSAAGQGSAAAGTMRRGTSLQSRRSKGPGSGSGSGDRDPLLRGSPQAPHRRNTHDPQQHTSRPRSSSTTETTPSSPTPGYTSGDVVLSSGYQSTEETDRIDRLEVSGLGQTPLAVSCGADGSFPGGEDGTPDPQRTKQAIAQLQQKILKLTEQIKIEQTARDDNVAEYLKLANNADKQQSTRIKQVFEKKNQKSAQTIQQLQRKLEHYHRKLREVEHNGIPRQPKDVLRDMQQGLKDVGAKVTGFSEGVVDSVKGGLSSFSQATHSAAGAVVSKPREIASLFRNKFGSADNIPSLKDSLDDPSVEECVTGAGGRSLGHAGHHLQPSPKYGSEDDCSSATSGSAGANSTTGAPGGPPSSKGNTLERSQSSSLDMLLQEVQELREGQARLEESLDGLKSHYQRDYTVVMQALQEERFRCERLEEQLNDLTELHQNEILNLKQELASMEEKIAYQSYERARDIQEALEVCQTRISKMELQQQQQQVVQLEGLENATARTLLGKLINVLLALMAVLLVFVSTVANCVVPLMKTRSRSLSTLLFILLLAFLWRNWDALSGYTHRVLQPPG